MEPRHFRLCTTCKTPIPFLGRYYVCSVSTCNRRPTALYFCSVPCWDAHVPDARHRDAWAEEATAPSREEFLAERASSPGETSSDAARRRVVSTAAPAAKAEDAEDAELPQEVLVVVSKLKAYVKARASMNTSDGVVDVLSDHLRDLCKKAIRSAAANSRKTVMARDFEAALEGRTASE